MLVSCDFYVNLFTLMMCLLTCRDNLSGFLLAVGIIYAFFCVIMFSLAIYEYFHFSDFFSKCLGFIDIFNEFKAYVNCLRML
jgi:hypothetical protein